MLKLILHLQLYEKKILTIILLVFCTVPLISQNLTIAGYVFGDNNKIALSYASVFVSNKPNIGTFTDENGFFTLKAENSDTLFISHVGYESMKVMVNDFKNQIYLKQNIRQLNEFTIKANRNNNNIHKKLGLYWKGSNMNTYLFGHDNYALLVPNETKREGIIKNVYYKIGHKKNKDKRYRKNKIQLRVRIYSIVKRPDKQNLDLLNQNVFIKMRQNQNSINIDLEEYSIPFPKEGIMLGIEIMGYLDENEELIQGSMSYCQKNMYIKETDRCEEKQTFFKNFNTAKWLSVSRFPKARSQEFYTTNAMFGIEVIFEEY